MLTAPPFGENRCWQAVTWHGIRGAQVFHAPHIRTLSSLLAVRFDPVRYTLQGDQLHRCIA